MQNLLKQTRTIERGPDGRIRKGFSIPSTEVKTWKDTITRDDGEEQEVDMIRVPVSSTGADRDGDHFSEEGIEHMVDQLKSGEVPLYANHGLDPDTGWQEYRFEHALGGWKDGEIENDVVYGTAALDPDNETADVLVRQIENGVVPVSFSVGFMPINADTRTNEEGEPVGRVFHEHDLFEVSRVGIPSNTDATISSAATMAAKGVAAAEGLSDERQIKALASEIEAAIKTGSPFDQAITNTMQGKENEGTMLDIIERRYLERDGTDPSDPLEEFLSWCEENDEATGAKDAADEFRASDEEATVADLRSHLKESDDDEDEDEDGDEDEEEDGKSGSNGLTREAMREELRSELEPLHDELRELRELLTDDGAEPEAEENSVSDELAELREEISEVRERNEELESRLKQTKEPKGRGAGSSGIQRAELPGESKERTATTAREAGNSRNGDGDALGELAEAMKAGEN